jgi:hypothetical protein
MWRGFIVDMFIWCPGGFPEPEWESPSLDLEIILLLFFECITPTIGLHLFSFFDFHDLQVCSFNGGAEFLDITFSTLKSFV